MKKDILVENSSLGLFIVILMFNWINH